MKPMPSIDDVIYQERMDQLAKRIGAVTDGENLLDVTTAMSGIICFCIVSMPGSIEDRRRRLEAVIKFMREQIERG